MAETADIRVLRYLSKFGIGVYNDIQPLLNEIFPPPDPKEAFFQSTYAKKISDFCNSLKKEKFVEFSISGLHAYIQLAVSSQSSNVRELEIYATITKTGMEYLNNLNKTKESVLKQIVSWIKDIPAIAKGITFVVVMVAGWLGIKLSSQNKAEIPGSGNIIHLHDSAKTKHDTSNSRKASNDDSMTNNPAIKPPADSSSTTFIDPEPIIKKIKNHQTVLIINVQIGKEDQYNVALKLSDDLSKNFIPMINRVSYTYFEHFKTKEQYLLYKDTVPGRRGMYSLMINPNYSFVKGK